MPHDFDDPQTALPAHSDVCIIGAGAAGILLATELARSGLHVTLLEGGGPQQHPRSQAIYRSEVDGTPHRGVHEGRFRTYGGSTTQWGGQVLELDPEDFTPRPHVPGSGWPFPKSTLTPFYERALRFEGLRRVERDDAAVWHGLGLAPPPLGEDLAQAFSRWCPERNFAALHGRELTQLPRLQVFTHASVTGFTLNDACSAIASVHIRGFSGRTATLAATRFVLCLGGIETTRLLLQPLATGTAPWQQNGLLGRHFQDHIACNGIPLRNLNLTAPWRTFGYVTLHGFRYHNKLKLRPERQHALATLNVAGTLGPHLAGTPALDRAQTILREVLRSRRRPTFSEAAAAALQLPRILAHRLRGETRPWRRLMLSVHCEQSPLSASSITLANDRDELGLLRTRLDWRISAAELHTLRAYVRAAQAAFTGLAALHPPPGFFTDDALVRGLCIDSNHHMGGVRISSSPADGLVDPDLRLHGLANAYVCSSAVFPTSGFSNPTHTLLALGMRLANHIATVAGGEAGFSLSSTNKREDVLAPAKREDVLAPARTSSIQVPQGFSLGSHAAQEEEGALAPGVPAAAELPLVPLPGSEKPTPQLGFGCAYLLGPGLDYAKSRRLLDAAYDAGIRHFDAARLYGQGHTESLLGGFLRSHPDATVTTKFGVLPPHPLQRAYAAAARRIPGLPTLHRNDKPPFTAAAAERSLHTSLRALGRGHVELFLLHEPTAADLRHDGLLDLLHRLREQGTIGAFGIGGEYARLPELLRERPAYAPVLQFEQSIFGPHLDIPGTRRIHYRGFARPAAVLAARLAERPGLLRTWSATLQVELEDPATLSALLLKALLIQHPQSLLLFSASTEDHIFHCAEAAASTHLTTPAQRLHQLLQTTDLGIREALYPASHTPQTQNS